MMQPAALAGSSVLIVEDDLLFRKQIAAHLERLGLEVTSVGSVHDARNLAGQTGFDFVLLDIHLPDGSGLDLLRDHALPTTAGIIVMTADGGVSGAVDAMRLGAADYCVKPFDLAELPLVLSRVRRGRQQARLEEHRRADDPSASGRFHFGPALAELERLLRRILEADARIGEHLPPILIQGETGTGKTTIARWIHHQGPRHDGPLVEMNCSALPEPLAEAELFGHERGAFTDAKTARMGLFEAAHGGTLFLDELPSLSPPLQAKVLKALEDHRIRRLGGRRELPVDVRIIAATSRDLKTLVAQGQFREDLLHRLDLYRVVLPPLRARGADIQTLADRLLDRLCQRHRLPPRRLGELARQRITQHPWPGNVRELAHELERALVFEDGETLELRQLAANGSPTSPATATPGASWLNESFTFPDQGFSLEAAINQLIHRALAQTHQNVSAAARLLGVSRDYIRYRLAAKRSPEGDGK